MVVCACVRESVSDWEWISAQEIACPVFTTYPHLTLPFLDAL
jgi:hypothetical protein